MKSRTFCCGKEAHRNESSTPQDLELNPFKYGIHDASSKVKEDGEKEESTHKREQWSFQIDFIFACAGYAVGAGNIYRFPYLCFRNGGGAFLIPYFTALIFCGIPLFFLELALGQFSSKGALHVWNICPLFKGLGYAMVIVSSIVTSYYNMVLTWILYYLFKSCAKLLPWSNCNNIWNTPLCKSLVPDLDNETNSNLNVLTNQTSIPSTAPVNSAILPGSLNGSLINGSLTWNSPATEFWRYNVLQISSGVEDYGGMRWDIFGFYILGWSITFFCLFKGVKSMGKVAYVTATLPYILLTILLIRGVLLPGAMDGIKYYIIPDWNRLLDLQVWTEAYLQIFYSLGPAWGGLVTMASHNKFNHNCLRDAILIPVINCLTSFYGGFVIFAIAGYLAHMTGKTVEEVGASGLGLTFIAYPEAIATMPISPLWSILFFLMMLSLIVDSQFGMFETMVGSIIDTFPKHLRKRKSLFIAAVCIFETLFGFLFCSRAGYYMFSLVDWYVGPFSLMLISCIECWVVYWVYGIDRFYYDISLMLGHKPSVLWKICWGYISPTMLLFVWAYNLVNYGKPYYLTYVYPTSAIGVGWVIAIISSVPVVYFFIKEMVKQNGSFKKRLLNALQPDPSWTPSDKTIDYKPVQATLKYQGILPVCLKPARQCGIRLQEQRALQNETKDNEA